MVDTAAFDDCRVGSLDLEDGAGLVTGTGLALDLLTSADRAAWLAGVALALSCLVAVSLPDGLSFVLDIPAASPVPTSDRPCPAV